MIGVTIFCAIVLGILKAERDKIIEYRRNRNTKRKPLVRTDWYVELQPAGFVKKYLVPFMRDGFHMLEFLIGLAIGAMALPWGIVPAIITWLAYVIVFQAIYNGEIAINEVKNFFKSELK